MRSDRETLAFLAATRRRRLRARGRDVFNLSSEEVRSSTHAAMRLADASKSQVEARSHRPLVA